MPDIADQILDHLPYLRRYARALLGSQKSGDLYVRLALETILADRSQIEAGPHLRQNLFRLFHAVLHRLMSQAERDKSDRSLKIADLSVEARMQALPTLEREVLLLNTLEGFSQSDIGAILDLSEDKVEEALRQAWTGINAQIATTVMIIEDEPVIALDIAGLVAEIGHTVVGVAASQNEAIALAKRSNPGLVLADIDLGRGGSGLKAVQEILEYLSMPVIFVTAYPERLLTGERPEPTYLVTKPFEPETLKVTISQALSMSSAKTSVRQAS